MYDQGIDPLNPEEASGGGMHFSGGDPSEILKMFFGGGSPFGFSSGGSGFGDGGSFRTFTFGGPGGRRGGSSRGGDSGFSFFFQ